MNVDILIPCAGNAAYVKASILSALNQSYTDITIYVLDNGCTHDLYKNVAEELSDDRVRYVKIEKRLGMVENWQRCLTFGNASLVSCLHDDDIWEPDYLETALECFRSAPETTVVLMPHYTFEKEPIDLPRYGTEHVALWADVPLQVRDFYVSTSNRAHMSAIVFRRQPICYPPEKFWMADQSFFAALVHYGNLLICGKSACHIRLSATSLTSGIIKTGNTSLEFIDHMRDMLIAHLRNPDFAAQAIPVLIEKAPASYIVRLLQASLGPPRRLAAYDFGVKLATAVKAGGKLNEFKYGALLQLLPIVGWRLIISVMNQIYFSRDLMADKARKAPNSRK